MTTTSLTAPSSTLISSLRAETTKMFTLRSTLVWAILLTGSIFGPVTLLVLFGKDGAELNWGDLMTGYSIFQLIAVIFAAAFTAGDIRNHMHAQAFLTQAKRWHWVVSKVIVVALFSAVTFIVGAALAVVVAALFGGNLALGAEEQHLYVALFSVVIFAAMTVGLSCVIRGQVASVAVPVTWLLVIDGMIGLAADHISVFRPLAMIAPNQRITQLFAGSGMGGDPYNLGLSTAVCYLIIIGWFVALTGFGLWRNQRSDIR